MERLVKFALLVIQPFFSKSQHNTLRQPQTNLLKLEQTFFSLTANNICTWVVTLFEFLSYHVPNEIPTFAEKVHNHQYKKGAMTLSET